MNSGRMLLSFAFLAAVLLVGTVRPAVAATEGPYGMEILVDGFPVQEYLHRGRTYVEARDGHEYAIRLINRTGRRVAVALSVDGLNTIDARHTTAYEARKWVLGPYETVVVRGWQISRRTARRFYFTTETDSYGAWLGRTRDLGNISAAFFPEVRFEPPVYYDEPCDTTGRYLDEGPLEQGGGVDRAAQAEAGSNHAGAGTEKRSAMAGSSALDDFAATGIGRRTANRVHTVAFEHGTEPAAVITVRYEFRDALVKLGVLPRTWVPNPYHRRETSSGFIDYGYAPDPYGGRTAPY